MYIINETKDTHVKKFAQMYAQIVYITSFYR